MTRPHRISIRQHAIDEATTSVVVTLVLPKGAHTELIGRLLDAVGGIVDADPLPARDDTDTWGRCNATLDGAFAAQLARHPDAMVTSGGSNWGQAGELDNYAVRLRGLSYGYHGQLEIWEKADGTIGWRRETDT